MKKWFQFPPIWFLLILYTLNIFGIGASIYCLTLDEMQVYCIFVYIVEAIIFFYSVYSIIFNYKRIKDWCISILHKNKITSNAISNYGFRTVLFSTITSTLNIAITIFTIVIAILGSSIWYGALAIYYLFLTFIRFYILYKGKKAPALSSELKIYRTCGIFLIILTFALSAAVIQMVILNEGFRYAEIMVIAVAAFSFYKFGLAIYNMVKARKYNNYYIQSLRNINLSSALVTLLSLQTALISAYGGSYDSSIMNAVTGGGVCFLIVGMGIYMIFVSNQKLKEISHE